MKKKTAQEQQHDAELDEYFESVNNNMLEVKKSLTLMTDAPQSKIENVREAAAKADLLKLMDMCMTTKWEKVSADVRAHVEKEPNVMRTEWVMDGKLNIPLDQRTPLTADFYMHKLRQEGHFSQMQDAQLFQNDRGHLYLLCVTMSHRVDADNVLTGNYVFRLINPSQKWSQSNFETKVRFADGICKRLADDFEILQETVVLQNFFFNVCLHHVSQPLFSVS
jgi:hypothetical protein